MRIMSPNNDADAAVDYEHPYLDSSAYIAAIQGEEGRADDIRQILRSAEEGFFRVVASTLVLAEVHKPGTTNWTSERIDSYFKHPHFRWVEVDYVLGVQARNIARAHGLRGADAVHLAGALRADADIFLTYDKKILSASDVGIVITKPYFRGQMSLSPDPGPPDVEPSS